MYNYCATPVNDDTIGMYVSFKFMNTDKASFDEQALVDTLTDEEIAKITEDGIKEEVVGTMGEEYWNQFA